MDRPIWVRLLAVLERNPESTTVTLNRASAEEMLHEIKRLQDGGCARDHGLTQYCAEAAEKDVEIERLKAEVERMRDMVRRAYNDGFGEGVKEHTTHKGGNPWSMSKWPAALTQEKTDV